MLATAGIVASGSLALALLAPGQASAKLSWSAPATLSSPELASDAGAVAMDAQGDAVEVWQGVKGTLAAARPAGGRWSGATLIGKAGQLPEVAMDPRGDAVVVWQRQGRGGADEVEAAVRPAAKRWQAPVQLGARANELSPLGVAMDSRGDAFALWEGGGVEAPVITSDLMPTGAGWQGAEAVSAPDEPEGVYDPELAVGAGGTALATWRTQSFAKEPVEEALHSAVRPVGGRWQSPVTLATDLPGGSAEASSAVDSHGNALVVWEGYEPGRGGEATSILQSALLPAGLTWQKPERVSHAATDEEAHPEVQTDSRGDAVAISLELGQRSPGRRFTLRADQRPAGGAWQAPVALYSTGPGAYAPLARLAVDGNGEAAVVWSTYTGSGPTALIEAATHSAGRGWSSAARVASIKVYRFDNGHGSIEANVPQPSVAIDAHGEAIATWYVYVGHGKFDLQSSQIALHGSRTRR